jgi:uncharacterized membrane protein YeiB
MALLIAASGFLALGLLALRSDAGVKAGISAQLAGLAVLAVAASATTRRRVAEPGEAVAGALIAVVLALAIGHPLDRWVELFPSESGQRWGGSLVFWGLATAVGLAVVGWTTRDPLDARRLTPRRSGRRAAVAAQ